MQTLKEEEARLENENKLHRAELELLERSRKKILIEQYRLHQQEEERKLAMQETRFEQEAEALRKRAAVRNGIRVQYRTEAFNQKEMKRKELENSKRQEQIICVF